MNKRLAEIASNRQRLLEQIESQRGEMAAIAQRWEKPLALADAGVEMLRFLRAHPIWVAGGLAVLLAARRKGVFDLLRKWWRLPGGYSPPFAFALELVSHALRAKRWLQETARPHKG